MSHFYATAIGSRSAPSCCGTKKSGAAAHVRGWEIGGQVEVSHVDGEDWVEFFLTGGSNNATDRWSVGKYRSNPARIRELVNRA